MRPAAPTGARRSSSELNRLTRRSTQSDQTSRESSTSRRPSEISTSRAIGTTRTRLGGPEPCGRACRAPLGGTAVPATTRVPGRHALALADEAEQDVLRADVVVTELERLAEAQLQHLLGAWRERDVPRRGGHPPADDLLDLRADDTQRHAEPLQDLGRHALVFAEHAE